MDVTTATSTTPSIYISEAQQTGRQTTSGHQSHQLQHHLGPQQHQHQMAKFRRDSIAHSQGVGGVSWGSLTVGSWLKEEVMIHAHMKDTFSGNNISSSNMVSIASPPSSSGSYLPNLEKQYCKDYSCCGQLLPGLHDLLRHYEEAHISTSPGHSAVPGSAGNVGVSAVGASGLQNTSVGNRKKVGGLQQQQQQPTHHHQHIARQDHAISHQTSSGLQRPESSQHHPHHHVQQQYSTISHHGQLPQQGQIRSHHSSLATAEASSQSQANIQTMQQMLHLNGNLVDAVCTNEVFLQTNNNVGETNATGTAVLEPGSGLGGQSRSKLDTGPSGKHNTAMGTQQSKSNRRQPQHLQQPVNFNNYSLQINSTKHGAATAGLQHSNNSRMIQKRSTLVSAAAGVDLDFMDQDIIDEFNPDSTGTLGLQHLGPMVDGSIVGGGPVQPQSATTQMAGLMKRKQGRIMNSGALGNGPSGRLSSKRSPNSSLTSAGRSALSSEEEDDDDQDDIDDEETTDKSRKQQGYIDDPARRLYVMDHEEHKPFKCPVIGCDKTYKNQNGLKYHKTHGHQNQRLHENPDGTFSIIDPESNEPYPDGMGFEKDKPYRCEVCGKRYKNLNGLKYHRGHSTH